MYIHIDHKVYDFQDDGLLSYPYTQELGYTVRLLGLRKHINMMYQMLFGFEQDGHACMLFCCISKHFVVVN